MSAIPPDPYRILGVAKDAQIPEIRSAHRKLVLKCHPDKVQDAELKAQKQDEFQKVQRAYELLSDDNERQKYDDQVKLAELRRQMQTKANISSPRSSPKYAEYEFRPAEPRASPFSPGPPPMPKSYSYSRSWEDDIGQGPRIFEPAMRSSPRREQSYADKPSKREAERERERERDAREREKDRDRERKRRSDRAERAEKEAKEARRAEKKQREKQRDKEIKRESEEKRRYTKPFATEVYEDEVPAVRLDKKKSSSRKYEDTRERERSAHRDDVPPAAVPVPPPPMGSSRQDARMNYASSYIEASRAKSGGAPGLNRSATYHSTGRAHPVPAAAPTPPPVPTQGSAFAAPDDDDARRSSARPRRGSGDSPRLSRERSYRTSSREEVDVVNVSPSTRHPAQFSKSSSNSPVMSSSPPRRDLPRTHTMPVDPGYSRPMPAMTRAQTFDMGSAPRGRNRSNLHSQIDEEPDSDDGYDRRVRPSKHRSTRRTTRSPEAMPEHVSRYQVDGGRTTLNNGYSRMLEPDVQEYYTSNNVRVKETRPSMPLRESAYSSSAGPGKFPKVKTSKSYSQDDIQYSNHSNHYARPHREEYVAY